MQIILQDIWAAETSRKYLIYINDNIPRSANATQGLWVAVIQDWRKYYISTGVNANEDVILPQPPLPVSSIMDPISLVNFVQIQSAQHCPMKLLPSA